MNIREFKNQDGVILRLIAKNIEKEFDLSHDSLKVARDLIKKGKVFFVEVNESMFTSIRYQEYPENLEEKNYDIHGKLILNVKEENGTLDKAALEMARELLYYYLKQKKNLIMNEMIINKANSDNIFIEFYDGFVSINSKIIANDLSDFVERTKNLVRARKEELVSKRRGEF